MGFLKEIESAEKRMNAARLALLDHIDLPARNNASYKKMVIELSRSIEEYTRLIRERIDRPK
jgi:hypothetical protein